MLHFWKNKVYFVYVLIKFSKNKETMEEIKVMFGFKMNENYIMSDESNSKNENNVFLKTFDDFNPSIHKIVSNLVYDVEYNNDDERTEYFGIPIYKGYAEYFKMSCVELNEIYTKLYDLISKNGYFVDYHIKPFLYIL